MDLFHRVAKNVLQILLLQGSDGLQGAVHLGGGQMAAGTLQTALGMGILRLQQRGHAVAEVGLLHTGRLGNAAILPLQGSAVLFGLQVVVVAQENVGLQMFGFQLQNLFVKRTRLLGVVLRKALCSLAGQGINGLYLLCSKGEYC